MFFYPETSIPADWSLDLDTSAARYRDACAALKAAHAAQEKAERDREEACLKAREDTDAKREHLFLAEKALHKAVMRTPQKAEV